MVIDGKTEFVGRNYGQAIMDAKSSAGKAKARIELNGIMQAPALMLLKGQIRLPESMRTAHGTVFVALVEDGLSSSVRSGENAGSRLEHSSVVRELIELDVINGSEPYAFQKSIKVTNLLKAKDLRLVVFVQAPSGEILGAATTKVQLTK